MNMYWLLLIVAGLLEVCWASTLKQAEGFTRLGPTLFCVSALVASIYLLGTAAKHLPIGTAYAVWVGIGALGTVIVAVLWHGEAISVWRGVFLVLLIASIIGLKLTSPTH